MFVIKLKNIKMAEFAFHLSVFFPSTAFFDTLQYTGAMAA